jgi:predicted nucleic acid-binding protein
MNPTAYIETSVISYLTARPSRDLVVAAYQQMTREWWRDAPRRFELVTSELVVSEAAAGDVDASRARLKILEGISLLGTSEETQALAEKLLDIGAIPPKAADDAAHIAIAVTNGVDYLVTWNFRHIANPVMRSTIEDACRAAGYKPPVVCAPNELLEG